MKTTRLIALTTCIGSCLVASAQGAPPPPEGGPLPPEVLKKFDKDGDGKLSDAESAAMREAMMAGLLERYDTDGDGKLSNEEKAKMPRFGRGPGGQRGPGAEADRSDRGREDAAAPEGPVVE